MRVALYARVSTQRQAQAQTVEQQLERLKGQAQQHGWDVPADQVFRDDGYSGASLRGPGLDRLRDRVAAWMLDLVVITAPDRLGANYQIDWSRAALDSASVPAPAGAEHTRRSPPDRGPLGPKHHLVVDRHCNALAATYHRVLDEAEAASGDRAPA